MALVRMGSAMMLPTVMQNPCKQDDEQDAEPEDGHRDADEGKHHADAIDRMPPMNRRYDTQDDAQNRGDDDGHQGKFDSRRETAHDLAGHG